jgi:hypothetical protein
MQTAISQQGNQNFEFTSSLKPAQRNAQHTNNHRVQRNEKKREREGEKAKLPAFFASNLRYLLWPWWLQSPQAEVQQH